MLTSWSYECQIYIYKLAFVGGRLDWKWYNKMKENNFISVVFVVVIEFYFVSNACSSTCAT